MELLSDCTQCRARLSPEQRVSIGCGYEPPSPGAATWSHRSGRSSDVCAGYLVRLPEAVEVARARLHWTHGELRSFTRGEPSEKLVESIEVLDGEIHDVEAYVMKEKRHGD